MVPFLFLIMAIVQFAFVFQAWITLNSAVRDASREASLYVYDADSTQPANDLARNNQLEDAAARPAQRADGRLAPVRDGIDLDDRDGRDDDHGDERRPDDRVRAADDDRGQRPAPGLADDVRATYHQDLVVPIISSLIPKDAGGRLQRPGRSLRGDQLMAGRVRAARRSRAGERGQILVLFLLAITALFAAAGLAFDVGRFYVERRFLQNAADAAALAAANTMISGKTEAEARAEASPCSSRTTACRPTASRPPRCRTPASRSTRAAGPATRRR